MVGKKDAMIIRMLQEDARVPMTDIAEEVGMSENGVRYRLNKMEAEGTIVRFTAILDPVKLGKNTTAVFSIDIDPKMITDSINLLKKMDEFIQIYHTTGEYPITAVALFDSMDHMNRFVNETFLRNIPVRNYSVNIVTEKYKDSIFTVPH